ncbi:2Fe-2S iron-sulfur cluster-binding protein [Aneurinibacillus tyrosinisolvens]|uniref:2Fe-2S iron-sulfur cluster-binding protein n=1 Tax=Aneurinibacillus tyrosinisolvens TaxID=1443435 RepID=UPI000A9BCF83|nr:2Fe-2S iron-sulfur cluster-binding protein [Aneurinibacillus tyrosinisolvens]
MKRRALTVGSLLTKKQQIISARKESIHQTKIHLQQNQSKFEVDPIIGQILLEAALQQGGFLDFKCRKGTCGRCTVQVTKGTSLLLPPNQIEQQKLNRFLTEGYRLACQAIIK